MRRRPRVQRVTAAAVAAGFSFGSLGALSGCGSSAPPGTAPTKWAATFCGALESWTTSVQSVTTALKNQIGSDTDAATVKNDTTSYFAQQLQLIDKLIAAVKGAGNPSVTDGAKIATALATAFGNYRAAVVKAQTQLAPVSPANTTTLHDTLDSIANDMDSAATSLGKAVQTVGKKYTASGDQPLVDALDANKTCRAFSTQS